MLETHGGEVRARVRAWADQALQALGAAAVALTREQLAGGYGRPVRRSGALEADIRAAAENSTVHVGSTLAYAPLIHGGSARMEARPFLRDALTGGADALRDAVLRVPPPEES